MFDSTKTIKRLAAVFAVIAAVSGSAGRPGLGEPGRDRPLQLAGRPGVGRPAGRDRPLQGTPASARAAAVAGQVAAHRARCTGRASGPPGSMQRAGLRARPSLVAECGTRPTRRRQTMTTLTIPYESLDPLTIGASGDDEGVPRDARARRPRGEPPGRRLPRRARAGRGRDRGGTRRARGADLRAAVLGDRRRRIEGRRHHRQPVPADSSVAVAARRIRHYRGGREARRRRLCERQGLPDVRLGHRAEARAREPRPDGAARHRVSPERPAQHRGLLVRRRLLARNAGMAAQRGRRVRREDHHRAGPVEPLGRRRRRQAHPAGRLLGRDDRVEPLRLRPLAADALRRVRRPDALGHRRGGDDVRAQLHDERHPRYARPRHRLPLRVAS